MNWIHIAELVIAILFSVVTVTLCANVLYKLDDYQRDRANHKRKVANALEVAERVQAEKAEEWQQQYRESQLKYDPLSQDEDVSIPVRSDGKLDLKYNPLEDEHFCPPVPPPGRKVE